MSISSKSDRDKIRQKAGNNKRLLETVRRVLKEYRQGRAATSCMSDIEREAAR